MVNKKYFLIILFVLGYFKLNSIAKKFNYSTIITVEQIVEKELNFQNLKDYMHEIKIHFPDIVFKQARIESGNFKSRICKENNNLFGMRLAKKRETTAVGENKKYAVYDNWQQSVDDYKLWQEYHKINENTKREDYLKLIGKIYAQDSTYVNKII